jgi:hypothetical protein
LRAAECQMLDWKDGSLIPSRMDLFMDNNRYTFSYGIYGERKNALLGDLICDFFAGKITDKTRIYIHDKVKDTPQATLFKECESLNQLMNTQWEFTFVDLNYALSESNYLQVQLRGSKPEFLIPFRSFLLSTSWKDKPFDEETLSIVRNFEKTDQAQIDYWMHAHSIIRRFIKRADHPQLDKYLFSLMRQFGFSFKEKRPMNVNCTFQTLKEEFIEKSAMLNSITKPFWDWIQQKLSEEKWHCYRKEADDTNWVSFIQTSTHGHFRTLS